MSTEPWWNDIGRRKLKNSEKNPPHCHFVYHRSHMGVNPGLLGERPVIKRLSHGAA
jgi:hypothetical protein